MLGSGHLAQIRSNMKFEKEIEEMIFEKAESRIRNEEISTKGNEMKEVSTKIISDSLPCDLNVSFWYTSIPHLRRSSRIKAEALA